MARQFTVKTAYTGWSSMRLVTFALQNGKFITRHAEDHGSAVGVLPYDPLRKVVTLLKMARAPVILHGDDDLLEVPAGCKDEVDPIEAVRREALEEAGLDLHSVEFVLRAWTMPAASTEQIGLYLARYEENSRVASGGGLQDEDEEMDVFEIPIAEVWAMYESGELKDMKTVVLIQALRLRYPELFE